MSANCQVYCILSARRKDPRVRSTAVQEWATGDSQVSAVTGLASVKNKCDEEELHEAEDTAGFCGRGNVRRFGDSLGRLGKRSQGEGRCAAEAIGRAQGAAEPDYDQRAADEAGATGAGEEE